VTFDLAAIPGGVADAAGASRSPRDLLGMMADPETDPAATKA